MLKILIIPVVMAVVAALGVGGAAVASHNVPAGPLHQVAAILNVNTVARTLGITTPRGGQIKVDVKEKSKSKESGEGTQDEEEVIHAPAAPRLDENESSQGELGEGTDVEKEVIHAPAVPHPDDDESSSAEPATVTRIGFQLTANGKVTAVGATTFTIMEANDRTLTFNVVPTTLFSGKGVTNLSKLMKGESVRVVYTLLSATDTQALDVVVRAH